MTEVDTAPQESGSLHQTFLVGDEIYLRRIEKDDARLTVSWRESLFPFAPSITETWISEDLTKSRTAWYGIVRKRDDRIVGSVAIKSGRIVFHVSAFVDPFYGELVAQWKAEAYRLVIPWLSEEQHRISVQIDVAADEQLVIATLLDVGCEETARFREKLFRDGERVDEVRFAKLNAQWIEKLGHPRDRPVERSGLGTPRPVPAPVVLDVDPPKNAIAVGRRIYLKAVDKEDAEELSRTGRQETDVSFGHSRVIASRGNKTHTRLDGTNDKLQETISFAIRLRADDRLIGECGLLGVDYLDGFAETFSWLYVPEVRGEGYGSEAKQLLLGYAFGTLGLHSLQSDVAHENLRSAAALRKQGYKEAGRLHWIGSTNGNFTGDVVFDLLASEWFALPRDAGDSETPS